MSDEKTKTPAPGSPRRPRRKSRARKARGPTSNSAKGSAEPPATAVPASVEMDTTTALAVAERTPLTLPGEGDRVTCAAPRGVGMYEVTSRDLQRAAALKRVYSFNSDASFAEAVYASLTNRYGGNPLDPILKRKGWDKVPPAERTLVRFGINLLKRVAPEALEAVKLSATQWAAESVGIALHTIESVARNPNVLSTSQGHALKACTMILELAGVISKQGKGGDVVVNVSAESHAQAAAIDSISQSAIDQVSAARQAMWDRAMGQSDDDGNSFELAPSVDYEVE